MITVVFILTLLSVKPLNKITIDYTLEGVTVEAPTFEPKEGNYEDAVTVTLACATEGASIYFLCKGKCFSLLGPAAKNGFIGRMKTHCPLIHPINPERKISTV